MPRVFVHSHRNSRYAAGRLSCPKQPTETWYRDFARQLAAGSHTDIRMKRIKFVSIPVSDQDRALKFIPGAQTGLVFVMGS